MIRGCRKLIEIHPSFGHLEKLVYVVIDGCFNLRMLPPITRSKKLETLVLLNCNQLFNSSRIQQNRENVEHLLEPFRPHNINHVGLRFFNGCLRKLDLGGCFSGDGDISSTAVWEFPNLQELDLHGNKLSRLNFSRILRLKYLNVKCCFHLVELLELPSSIAVVIADDCNSLESFGDISNCKWLWKFSLWGNNKLGPLDGDILLNTMLQVNAKDYFMSINLSNIDIWMGTSVVWIDWVKTYNMLLPHNWYNHFSGILMFTKCNNWYQRLNIIIKQGVDEDFQSEFWQESNQTLESSFHDTYVGYVSFSSLRRTGYLNSTYNMISFSMGDSLLLDRAQNRFRARVVLIPKDDPMQTAAVATNCSEFWDKEVNDRKTFTLQHDSNSSIKISWFPWI